MLYIANELQVTQNIFYTNCQIPEYMSLCMVSDISGYILFDENICVFAVNWIRGIYCSM